MSIVPSASLHWLGEHVAQLSPAAASLLIASVWRGVLLALVVALAMRMLPKLSPAVRSAIWLCVLLVVLLSPGLSAIFSAPHADSAASGLLHMDSRWSYVLLGIWAALSMLRLTQLAVSAWQLRGLARNAEPFVPEATVADILHASPRHVQLCTSDEIDRPSVVGFFRPRILLPASLPTQLSAFELEQIVMHELEHLRRYDDWTNLLQKFSVALLPLHPVVVWLDRRLCLERELACDDGVVRATQARKSYAACLTGLAERSLLRRGASLALGAIGSWKPQSEVAKRVYRILAKPEAVMGRTQARIAAGAMLAGTLCASLGLAHTPHLVTFTNDDPIPTVAASISEASAPHSSTFAAPHYVAAKAVLPTGHATFAKAIVSSAGVPHAVNASLRSAARKPSVKRVQQRRIAQVPQAAPLFHLTALEQDDVPAARFALAIEDDAQPRSVQALQLMYAAVPVRGGWLIVQL